MQNGEPNSLFSGGSTTRQTAFLHLVYLDISNVIGPVRPHHLHRNLGNMFTSGGPKMFEKVLVKLSDTFRVTDLEDAVIRTRGGASSSDSFDMLYQGWGLS